MAGLTLQYGAVFPNQPSRRDSALRDIEFQRQQERVNRMTSGNASNAIVDMAGNNDRPVLLEDSGAYRGAINETPDVDESYTQMSQNMHVLFALDATRGIEEERDIMQRLQPSQVHAMSNFLQMGGRLMPRYAKEREALRQASARGTGELRRHMQMGGSFETFRQDTRSGVAGFFKSFLDPKTFIPMLIAGAATLATGGLAAPALAAAAAAGAAGIGSGVAGAVSESQRGRAERIEGGHSLPDQNQATARQFGVRI